MTLRSGEVFFSEQSEGFRIPESVSLFGFIISFYGIFLVLATLIGIIVVTEMARRKQQNTEKSITLITLVIVSALLGGRLYYVLFEWEKFIHEPLMVLNFRSGGLSYFGALFGAWFAVRGYCRKTGEDFMQYADTLCVGAAAAAPFIWAGCAFIREPLGRFYKGVFAVKIGSVYEDAAATGELMSVHPLAVYGIILGLITFAGLCVTSLRAKQSGTVFSVYLMVNAVIIFGLECFRADSYMIWGTEIPANFVVAAVMFFTVTGSGLRQLSINRKLKKIRFNGN